jgi:hypothetical protein
MRRLFSLLAFIILVVATYDISDSEMGPSNIMAIVMNEIPDKEYNRTVIDYICVSPKTCSFDERYVPIVFQIEPNKNSNQMDRAPIIMGELKTGDYDRPLVVRKKLNIVARGASLKTEGEEECTGREIYGKYTVEVEFNWEKERNVISLVKSLKITQKMKNYQETSVAGLSICAYECKDNYFRLIANMYDW